MRTFPEADLFRLFLCFIYAPAVSQHATDHPERSHADGAGTMDEGWAVLGIVGDLQEFSDLLIFRIGEHNGNVVVAQPQFFGHRLFFSGTVFARRPQVNDGFDALGFQLGQLLNAGLPARAKLIVDAQEVPDRRAFLLPHAQATDDARNQQERDSQSNLPNHDRFPDFLQNVSAELSSSAFLILLA